MDFFAKTDIGKIRENNEDYCFAGKLDIFGKDLYLFVVADGMGGCNKGEIASFMAAEEVVRFVKDSSDFIEDDPDKILKVLELSVKSANKSIFEKSFKQSDYFGMGTTIIAGIICQNHLYIVNVGDSRAYRISDGEFAQLTKDNSYVQQLLEEGLINDAQAKIHKKKNVITRAVGSEKNLLVDKYDFALKYKDVLLFCSDGLTNMCEDNEIKTVLEKEISSEEKAMQLVELANRSGGRDNITVIVVNC